MRVMVLGANGFIGSAVCARLLAVGHDVVGVARRGLADRPGITCLKIDLAQATEPEIWRSHLDGVDAIVNAAGVLQDGPGDDAHAVHVDAVSAIYRACEAANVRRIVHVSAIGVDRGSLTPFSSSKKAGEAVLTDLDLDWVLLRPSVVVGRAAYGGSALLRGLASLPLLPEIPEAGRIQVVQLDDLISTVLYFLDPAAPARVALDVAGPERLEFADVVLVYRRWLGLGEPRRIRLPRWTFALAYRVGDLAGWLGWRAPIRSTARRELARGATGDAGPWMRMTGIKPKSLTAALNAEPASVQERWFSRLYLLKPLVLVILAVFWIATGFVALGPGREQGVAFMASAGVGTFALPSVVAAALADIAIGFGIIVRRWSRFALWAALAVSVFYLVAGTILWPALWADSLGTMTKILPIMVLNLVALALLPDR